MATWADVPEVARTHVKSSGPPPAAYVFLSCTQGPSVSKGSINGRVGRVFRKVRVSQSCRCPRHVISRSVRLDQAF